MRFPPTHRLFSCFVRGFCCLTVSLYCWAFASCAVARDAQQDTSEVKILEQDGVFRLVVDGHPFFVKGAGADRHFDRLANAGANTIRTWGSDQTVRFLDEAQAVGLKVIAGLWVEHERHGFDYDDSAAVAGQIELHKADILKFKDHPALLMWMVGNELEHQSRNDKVWDTVEALAAFIKEVDPHHPVGTVTAHPNREVIGKIVKQCPSLDILGFNSYAGLPVVQRTVEASAWLGPYLVTEWGPNGSWEVGVTSWGAEIEPSSTEKAEQYLLRYKFILEARDRCLGSCMFFWGQKQETTSTWYGIFTGDGLHTEVFDVMSYLWGGEFPAERTPRLIQLKMNDHNPEENLSVEPESGIGADFILTRGDLNRCGISWEVFQESSDKRTGGDAEIVPEKVAMDFKQTDVRTSVQFAAPADPGAYRLYLYVDGPGGGVVTANFPFRVN